MRIESISKKQAQIMRFALSNDYALICDGSVRSGKTVMMTSAFVIWAMEHFDKTNFAICGKTVQSAERNVLKPLQQNETLPYKMSYKVSTKVLTVRCGKKENYFYIFGGKDESSYTLIQGITLAGVLFDEVALMPKSFVDQALSRCISYENPKYWFNCNPESPSHWFYLEWVKADREGVKKLHFHLEDNPILNEKMIERTKALYTGVFYQRYILGEWVIAEGLVYQFGEENITDEEPKGAEYYVSVDYGTLNPLAAQLWSVTGDKAVMIKEYYYSGREGECRTDDEYCDALDELCEGYNIKRIVVDPSAASFITALRKRKWNVQGAKNEVMNGIRNVSAYLKNGNIKINRNCTDTIREFGLYRWDQKSTEDKVIKENDHAMDALRYFCSTILKNKIGKSDNYIPFLMR